jgi:hypothetical protein
LRRTWTPEEFWMENPTRGPIRMLLSASVSPPTIQFLTASNWTQPAPTLFPANTLAPVDEPPT